MVSRSPDFRQKGERGVNAARRSGVAIRSAWLVSRRSRGGPYMRPGILQIAHRIADVPDGPEAMFVAVRSARAFAPSLYRILQPTSGHRSKVLPGERPIAVYPGAAAPSATCGLGGASAMDRANISPQSRIQLRGVRNPANDHVVTQSVDHGPGRAGEIWSDRADADGADQVINPTCMAILQECNRIHTE